MASESSESSDERTRSVTLPEDLSDWLDEKADSLDVDVDTLLEQLLASYQMTADESVDDDLAVIDESVLNERLTEATNGVKRQLGNRIDAVETDYQENLEDVRQRVIQVKKETDAKAPANHDHEVLNRIPDLAAEIDALNEDIGEVQSTLDETIPGHADRLAAIESTLETIEDRLKTVAWVVSDLREAQESSGGLKAVERIKRAAAKANVERANCERCGEPVAIALLTDPECPHCSATVSNVEPAGGWFGKPTLQAASQLESGEQ